MAFVKIQKTNAYYKRYQTKYRRRREGKTDYYARKRLVTNDKNKYNSPRYRFVPRITCSRVLCQVIYSTLAGDKVLCSADSKELRAFGLKAGLTNYSAAYCTGLLCARRLLKQLGMDKYYPPVQKVTGEDKETAENPERRPFKAVLDVGLVRTTTGNRVFGALKGALDGGLLISHSSKRFPGYAKDKYDAKAHRDRIFGVHVDKYMKELKKQSEEDY